MGYDPIAEWAVFVGAMAFLAGLMVGTAINCSYTETRSQRSLRVRKALYLVSSIAIVLPTIAYMAQDVWDGLSWQHWYWPLLMAYLVHTMSHVEWVIAYYRRLWWVSQ